MKNLSVELISNVAPTDENKILSIPVHRNQNLKIGTLKSIMKIANLTDNDL